MKVFEVRDGFIKFEADDTVCPAGFLLIEDHGNKYIGQVIQLKKAGIVAIAYAKILYNFDGSNINEYDNTVPSKNASIETITSQFISDTIQYEKPVIIGKTFDNNCNIVVDSSIFDKNFLASIDSKDCNNIVVRNIAKQFENINTKTLIIDTLGVINSKKYIAGKDFKLPLDTASLAFMYDSCLSDATEDSKSIIVDIFRDLSEYSKTVPFVPFGTLKSIVDDLVDKSHLFKLLVLKNKLSKFDKLGYFATTKQEVESLNKIIDSKCAIVDLSKLDSAFQNRYLAFIYEILRNSTTPPNVILELSNTITKKNIKQILSSENIKTALITHSNFNYLNDFKGLFKNFIIEPSFKNSAIFSEFMPYLKILPKDSYIVSGTATNNITFASKCELINDFIEYQTEESDKEIEEIKNTKSNTDTEYLQNTDFAETNLDELRRDLETENSEQDDITENNIDELGYLNEIINTPNTDNNSQLDSSIDNLLSKTDIESEGINTDEVKEELTEETAFAEENLDIENSNNEIFEKEDIIEEYTDTGDAFNDNSFESLLNDNENDSNNIAMPFEQVLDVNDDTKIEEQIISDNSLSETLAEYIEETNSDTTETLSFDNVESIQNNTEEQKEEDEEQGETKLESDADIVDLSDIDDNIDNLVIEDNNLKLNEQVDNNEEEFINIQDHTNNENNISDKNSIIEEINDYSISENDDNNELDVNEAQSLDFVADNISEENTKEIIPINTNDNADEFTNLDDFVELDLSETSEDDIIIDMGEDSFDEEEDTLNQEIIKDVDKVFTTRKEDDITDSDLDFIDEINSEDNQTLDKPNEDDNILEQPNFDINTEDSISAQTPFIDEIEQNAAQEKSYESSQEQQDVLEKKDTTNTIVPVYEAEIPQEDIVMSDPIQQGDTVMHAKYGTGVVEKMIKYGNKTLFAINFDNIGRRLLDPTIAEIKKC